MAYSWLFIVDPSVLLLIVIACATIWYGSYRSTVLVLAFFQPEMQEQSEIKMSTAILLPVIGSVMLVLLFWWLHYLFYLLVALLAFSSFTGVIFMVYPWVESLCQRFHWEKSWTVRYIGEVSLTVILCSIIAIIMIVLWLATKFFLIIDALAICLAVSALSFIKLPNLKISTVILCLFFVYDIFWVFLSSFIFHRNVMVSVATQLPVLPMVIVMPRMLSKGGALLGLGDIVLPGLFLCFLYRYDKYKGYEFKKGYFLRSWIGYFCGIVLTIIMVAVLQMGQPALLYLVPGTLIPCYFVAYREGELKQLWHGMSDHNHTIEDEETARAQGYKYVPDDEVPPQ